MNRREFPLREQTQMPLAGLAASGPARSKAGASVDVRNALAAEPASGINFGARIR